MENRNFQQELASHRAHRERVANQADDASVTIHDRGGQFIQHHRFPPRDHRNPPPTRRNFHTSSDAGAYAIRRHEAWAPRPVPVSVGHIPAKGPVGLVEVTNQMNHANVNEVRNWHGGHFGDINSVPQAHGQWSHRRQKVTEPPHVTVAVSSERFRFVSSPGNEYRRPHPPPQRPGFAYVSTYWSEKEALTRREALLKSERTGRRFVSSNNAMIPPGRDHRNKWPPHGVQAYNAHHSISSESSNNSSSASLPLNREENMRVSRPGSTQIGPIAAAFEVIDEPNASKRPLSPPKTNSIGSTNQEGPSPKRFALSSAKRSKAGMLDILCSATLELGPIQVSPPAGCSCPRSNCIKLYCDCFKAGRPCSNVCSCVNCKNNTDDASINAERIQAIKNTLARNPRAFTGGKKDAIPLNPGDIVCNCLRSRCLKLYCQCFHKGRLCNEACLCISCLNTNEENKVGGARNLAIRNALEKRPDAFTKKPKKVGSGCACRNNKCLKKYCECFRFELQCSEKCVCRDCGNGKP